MIVFEPKKGCFNQVINKLTAYTDTKIINFIYIFIYIILKRKLITQMGRV